MTTINSDLDAVSVEARIIGLVVRIVALGMSGYVTATIAVYLLGVRSDGQQLSHGEVEELRHLRSEVRRLSTLRNTGEGAGPDHSGLPPGTTEPPNTGER